MGLDYGWEKLYLAIRTLVGSKPMRDRLQTAYVYNLIHLTDSDVAEGDGVKLEEVKDQIQKNPDGLRRATVEAVVDLFAGVTIAKEASQGDQESVDDALARLRKGIP
jgi:hypothetical protein